MGRRSGVADGSVGYHQPNTNPQATSHIPEQAAPADLATRPARREPDAPAISHEAKHRALTQAVSDFNSRHDKPRQVPQKEYTAPGVFRKQPLNVKMTARSAKRMLSTPWSLPYRRILPA
jgi:hypothetical protein